MIKSVTIISLFLLLATGALSQNRAHLRGRIVDSTNNAALELATVAVLDAKDTSLISYTLTLKTGDFALHNLPSGKDLKLLVTFISHNSYRKTLRLEKGSTLDLGAIKLSGKGHILGEIKVRAEITPVIIKKDTIEFSAEAFKTPPNAVVEELLKRLPGMQVDMDGTITVNGKTVSKLYIGGKRFFANDPKIASKNLDAVLVDKIQVYDDREDDPDHLIPDSKVGKIINLKLKRAIKRSTFGKVRAGGGTRDRFDGGVLYNMFRDTLQISLIGVGNNLNRTGFSTQDLMGLGGFNRSGYDNLYNGTVTTGGRSYGGIQTVGSGGVNVNNDYGKKLKLNLLYFYSYTSDLYNNSVFSQQFLKDTTLSSNNQSGQTNKANKHTVTGLLEWETDSLTKIRYTPKISFNNNNRQDNSISNSYSNFVALLNNNSLNNFSKSNGMEFQQNLSIYRRLRIKKGASLNITHDLNISPDQSNYYRNSYLQSFTAQLSSSNLQRFEDADNKSNSASINVTYRYPFSKRIYGSLQGSFNYRRSVGKLFTYDRDLKTGLYSVYIDSLSRDLHRQQYTETLGPEISYQHKDLTMSAKLGLQWLQRYDQFNKKVSDINKTYIYALPSVRIDYNHLSFNYNNSVQQPDISNLLPYRTVYSQLYSSIGNPDLKPTRTHNLNFNYYKYITEKQLNFSFSSDLNLEQNSIFNERTVNGQGVTASRPINRSGVYRYYFSAYGGRGFKKMGNWQLRINNGVYYNFNHQYFQVNDKSGFQNTTSINFSQQFYINWNNKFELNPNYYLSSSSTKYQDVDYAAIKYISHHLDIPVTIRAIKHITFEANYNYSYNPLVSPGLQRSVNLVNIALARLIQKNDHGEIRVSCYDLLNQNVNSYRFVSGNTVADIQTQILKRYFLLSYAYHFNKVISKN
ncbi:outer membrane beta-barrel protein [Mucilaginibacter sp. CSA2-8R]|uniref:outer membrane beta-barrel protein n=1 Tax=Mucilaginibacter sp. CSA2-8R TaxID=3141542 RepID=UPI00315D199A